MQRLLISIPSDDEENISDSDNSNENKILNDISTDDRSTDQEEEEEEEDYEFKNNTMYLIHNEQIDSDDPHISEFLKFCLSKGLFDNTFYDMHNSFSIVATKLPQTFEKLSNDADNIGKKIFIKKFKTEYGYPGNIAFIYSCFDKDNKNFITWDDFLDFFLPYVQYITV